ncbi:aggregation-promoting factor C-terminal-like domain-containing protein [Halostreptopolyspora alba]|uniref:aggregation-promoting factor C-terminal-like domain-containing protein n=1 Tax=Halostreptopolyspora alba TaxID=2487137 RepID=UPI003714DBD7
MLLNRISMRVATAVGAATMVAGGTFAVSAFADSGLEPDQAASAAMPPDEAEPAEDFFAEPENLTEDELQQLREQRDEANAAAGAAVTGVTKAEEEEEEEDEEESVPSGDPKAIAKELLGNYGWGSDQFDCLEPLWEKESGWDHTASNPSSGAYGIPQALPGSKMASEGDDWRTNPTTQIKWGLGYIEDRYSSPCDAWNHSQANNWY